MNPKHPQSDESIQSILEELKTLSSKYQATLLETHPKIAYATARLTSIIAAENAKSSARMERYTFWLIGLTWGVVFLTIILTFYTIKIYQDSRADTQRGNFQEHHQFQNSEPPKPKP